MVRIFALVRDAQYVKGLNVQRYSGRIILVPRKFQKRVRQMAYEKQTTIIGRIIL